jgi:hypothetical protein
MDAWMESPTLRLLHEPAGYWNELRATFLKGKLTGAQVHDALIHSICRASGVRQLWSADRDFSRMRGLDRQPLRRVSGRSNAHRRLRTNSR